MVKGIRKISLEIYADSEEEAEKGRQSIIQFINLMRSHNAMVSGDKIAEAVSRLDRKPFIKSQIIQFFKK